jgi:hypothetical protein
MNIFLLYCLSNVAKAGKEKTHRGKAHEEGMQRGRACESVQRGMAQGMYCGKISPGVVSVQVEGNEASLVVVQASAGYQNL